MTKRKRRAGRKPIGDEPMVRRNVHLPPDLWTQVQSYAAELGQREGKPVSTAEAVRRILERAMKRRGE